MSAPDTQKQWVNLDDIQLWDRNPNQGDVGAIMTMIKQFGYRRPIGLWQDNITKSGNHRTIALRNLRQSGWTPDEQSICLYIDDNDNWFVEYVDDSDLDAQASDAFGVADNRATRLGYDDPLALAELLQELANDDKTLFESTGYDGDDLDELLASITPDNPTDDPGAQIDRAEELNEKWGVKRGDLWVIPSKHGGEHRLLCGDSTSEDVVKRLMDGEIAEILTSDPPYNVNVEYGNNSDDSKDEIGYNSFSKCWVGLWMQYSDKQIITPGGINHFLWMEWFDPYHIGIWVKTNALTRGRISNSWCWEPIFFFGSQWDRNRNNDIFDYPIGKQKDVANHPCPKPIKLWTDIIKTYSILQSIICDPFLGSGTTMVASEQLNRKCYGIEIEPKYCAVILERMSGMGLEPVLSERTDHAKT